MLIVFRPSFEQFKVGRILHFVSGYRKFYLLSGTYPILLPPDVASLILVDAGKFCRFGMTVL
jgi:hypothetical protein